MTADFSDLFSKSANPSTAQINTVAASYPSELVSEGFSFQKPDGSANQSIIVDPNGNTVNATVQSGPFSGMIATITPLHFDVNRAAHQYRVAGNSTAHNQ